MPLQAFNTDANGTMFHNLFSPIIFTNKQCYLNSQIQSAGTTINSFGDRFLTSTTNLYFIPEETNEEFALPVSATNYRCRVASASLKVQNAVNEVTTTSAAVSITDTGVGKSTFVVANNKAIAWMQFANNGTIISSPSISILGVVDDPLFTLDLVNTRYCNHFGFHISSANAASGGRPANNTTKISQSLRTTATISNYTFQCALDSGDGTTVSGLWATHLALVDNTNPPGNYCIGTVPPIVLIGRGNYTLGSIYKFNNVGSGTANSNAYDRWYIAGPTYGPRGDRILMQVYYEP